MPSSVHTLQLVLQQRVEGFLSDSPKSPFVIKGVVDRLLDGKQHHCDVPVVVVDAEVHILGMAPQARHPQWLVLTVGMALHVNLHCVPLLARCSLSRTSIYCCSSTFRLRLRSFESSFRITVSRSILSLPCPCPCCALPPEYCVCVCCPPCRRRCELNNSNFCNSNFLISRSSNMAASSSSPPSQ